MTAAFFDNVFATLCDRRPFQPFTVELVGGDRFEVDHPRAMVVRDGRAIFMRPGGAFVWFDHESVTQVIDDIANGSKRDQVD